MVKTYLKTLIRVFKKHYARFLSVIFMVLISVGFISGIGGSVNKIDASMTDYYKAQNVSDFILKSTDGGGFSETDVETARSLYGEESVNTGMSVDVDLEIEGEKRLVRLYFLDEKQTVNLREKRDERAVEADYKASAEESDNKLKNIPLGTEIEIDFRDVLSQLAEQEGEDAPDFSMIPPSMEGMFKRTVTVAETVLSPLTFGLDGEPSYRNPSDTPTPETINEANKLITLEGVLYMSTDVIPVVFGSSLLPKTGDMYIALPDRNSFNAYSKDYDKYISQQESVMGSELEGEFETLTLYKNYSFYSLKSYGEKVMGLTAFLLVVFLFITGLVVQSNISRLMEEERSQIACLRTLGYNAFKIVFKYVLFVLLATGIGGVGAYFVGIGLAALIYNVFNYSFVMPAMASSMRIWFYLVAFAVIVVTALLSTWLSGARMMHEKPANLLRPKAPKAGRKVILERMPLIWNRFSFKYKSSLRNVLRYRSRFIMTLVAVAGAMGLVLAGLALLDMCLFGDFGSMSIMFLALVIVIFAGLLTAVVIYTLTNINISEREREIATLMVLGYHDKEVAGYIYREIYINTGVGIVFGYPFGLLFIWAVFKIIDFGALSAVGWYVWLIAPFVTLLFTFIVTLILRRKIVKIDMNNSLKAIE